MSMILISEEKL